MKLNGFYKGKVSNPSSNWLGKTFFAAKSSGINNFKENANIVQKYPFKTYEENKNLILDYNLKENPWWLRFVVDEIKEADRNKFEGKIKIKILSKILIPIGEFGLEISKK